MNELAVQFLSESVISTFLAGLIGLALAEIFLGRFNLLVGVELDLMRFEMLALSSVAVVIMGILAGVYPAIFLSSLQPGTPL